MEVPDSSLSNWLVRLTTKKYRGLPTIISLEEEIEVFEWCQDLAQLGFILEVTQHKSHVAQTFQKRKNPLKNGFLVILLWVGFQKHYLNLTNNDCKESR